MENLTPEDVVEIRNLALNKVRKLISLNFRGDKINLSIAYKAKMHLVTMAKKVDSDEWLVNKID